MKKLIHKSETRGHEDHGWLNARHSFSFANYYNPERIHFGALRVLNDDVIRPGMGFGSHPHDNMEIITIPLSGAIQHRDSMGNGSVIKAGEVQHMSAGSGITHSEYNASGSDELNLLQIWLFPREKNIKPVYNQIQFSEEQLKERFYEVVSSSNPGGIKINQDATFSLGRFSANQQIEYSLQSENNGVYLFIIEGEIQVDNEVFSDRDGIGIRNTIEFAIDIQKPSYLLLMEVPM
jgi:quercetin 2,3-dioxygenase